MSINFTSSVFVFLLILECVNNVFICLFIFMENKTKMSINILLLLFAVLITSSCPLNPPSVFHNYVLVWWKMWVNKALWMIPYWTLGILKQGFHPDPLHVPLVYSILPFMLILHQVTTPKTPGLNLTPGRKPWLEGLSAWLQIAWHF